MNASPAKTILSASLLVLSAGGFSPASADVIGQVLFAKGDVQIVGADGVTRPARQGDPVSDGERVITGPGALGQIRLSDGGRVGVRAQSGVRFEPPAAGAPRTLELTGGNVRVLNMSDGGATPAPYVLRTSQGQVQVRDADTLAAIVPAETAQGAGSERTVIKLNRGTGIAAGKAGTPLEMRSGETVAVVPGAGAPSRLADARLPQLAPAQVPAGARPAAGSYPIAEDPGRPLTLPPTGLSPPVTRTPVLAGGFQPADALRGISPATGAPPAAPTRVVDPIVLSTFTTRRLPTVQFTDTSTSTIDQAARSIVSVSSGGTISTPSILGETRITSPTGVTTTLTDPTLSLGGLTGTLSGTKTTVTSTKEPVSGGNFSLGSGSSVLSPTLNLRR